MFETGAPSNTLSTFPGISYVRFTIWIILRQLVEYQGDLCVSSPTNCHARPNTDQRRPHRGLTGSTRLRIGPLELLRAFEEDP